MSSHRGAPRHRAHSDDELQSASCLMCLLGHIVVRRLVFGVWCVLGMPLKLLESWVWGPLTQYFRTVLLLDGASFVAALLTGGVLSVLVFIPLATLTRGHPHVLCTTYLCHLAWALGQVAINLCIYADVVRRQDISDVAKCLTHEQARCRLLTLGDGGYLGIALGLGFAFPYTAFVTENSFDALHATDVRWCRASHEVSRSVLNTCVYAQQLTWYVYAAGQRGVLRTGAVVQHASWSLREPPGSGHSSQRSVAAAVSPPRLACLSHPCPCPYPRPYRVPSTTVRCTVPLGLDG